MPTYEYSQTFGTASVSGNTPFGIYDDDTVFTSDCKKQAVWTAKKLGGVFLTVELDDSLLYGSFEEATQKFNSEITSHDAVDWLLDYIGQVADTGSDFTGQIPRSDISFIKSIVQINEREAEINSLDTLFTGSFTLPAKTQMYDLKGWGQDEGLGEIEIRQIWFYPTPTMLKYLAPGGYGTLGSSDGYVLPTINHPVYIYPVFTAVMREQENEMLQTVGRSNYRYKLYDNKVWISPPFSTNLDIYFTYYKTNSNKEFGANFPTSSVQTSSDEEYKVTNISNIPFQEIEYKTMNSASRDWIKRYSMAVAKEILGNTRSKLASIPAPGGDITLNGAELLAQSEAEKDKLIEELRERLDKVSNESLMEKRANLQTQINQVLSYFPFPKAIYVA